jgi:hypothetical protein
LRQGTDYRDHKKIAYLWDRRLASIKLRSMGWQKELGAARLEHGPLMQSWSAESGFEAVKKSSQSWENSLPLSLRTIRWL